MRLVHGVGINDADYPIRPKITDRNICPFYSTWANMLVRCYSKKALNRDKTYVGCSVTEEWLTFSNFKRWMEKQDWVGNQLDKDLKVSGNKLYAPEFCTFVPQSVNLILGSSKRTRGEYPVGVCLVKSTGRFISYINIKGVRVNLGSYDTKQEAHREWQKEKIGSILHLSTSQSPEISSILRRYADDIQHCLNNNLEFIP